MSDRPDDADVLAAVERAEAGSTPARDDWPACASVGAIRHLFEGRVRGQEARAYAHCKALVARGMLRRMEFSGHIGWTLTPAGSALAQDGVIRCEACMAPAIEGELERYSYAGLCREHMAERLEELATSECDSAAYWRGQAQAHLEKARELRRRAQALRSGSSIE